MKNTTNNIIFYDLVKENSKKLLFNMPYLEIKTDKIILITGDNGSGKTTFLKILNGIVSSKGYGYYGSNKFLLTKKHFLSKTSVYLPTKPYLFNCSVQANVNYCNWFTKPFFNDEYKQIMSLLNIYNIRKNLVTQLSSGEKQKVSIARAMMKKPQLWLLDEPLSNLDDYSKKYIINWIQKLYKNNIMFIITTHNKNLFSTLPTRVYHIDTKTKKIIEYDD